MDIFTDLMKKLQKNDKITLNVLVMISESQSDYESIGKSILLYYKTCTNPESIRWFLTVLCEKDENYLEYFSRYSKLFDSKNDNLTNLFSKYKNTKKIKLSPPPKENVKTDDLMYNILFEKVQCKLCGLRYKENDPSYDVHIEDHMRKTRALDEKSTLSREYFSTFDGWIKNMEKITLNLKIDKIEKVIYSGGTCLCKICGHKIETVWDEEEDEFVLSTGVKLDEEEYCHKSCVI
ncbi:cleavage and polyadenylation factor subunit (PCF11) [Vairimorpha necatrix]|uniref:Cleavage and polyadenylation factor subunit (PCF11) n=1 Tax=Vairimorpha necatrix TaxID=6039 RepID=A0AAX4JF36_9MICR